MKLYKYSLIAALALSGALCACDDDVNYTPGPEGVGQRFYLPVDAASEISLTEGMTSLDLNVYRVEDTDAATVGITSTVTDEDGNDVSSIFSVPTQVSFAVGETDAPLVVAVDFDKVEAEMNYTLTLSLQSDDISAYGASEQTITLLYAPWTAWEYIPGGVATYTDSWFEPGDYEIPVVVSESVIDPNRVKYGLCNTGWFFYGGSDDSSIDVIYTMDYSNTIDVNGVECPIVSMSPIITNYTSSNYEGTYCAYDVRTWLLDFVGRYTESNVDAAMANNDFGQSYYNPETGTFCINMVWTMTSFRGTSSAYNVAYDYLQLPGYKSYQIAFDFTGNFVDGKGTEYAVVNAFKSNDVAYFVSDIFPGKLSDAGIDAAIEEVKSNDALEQYTSSTSLTFALEEAGQYTVVGVGYDENGNSVCTASYSFSYESVQGAPKWESVGYCEYTDGIINSMYKVGGETWDVEIQENIETPGLYRLVNPYKDWAEAYGVTYPDGNYYIVVNAVDADRVYLDMSDLGVTINETDGSFYVWSMAGMYLDEGFSADQIAAAGYFGTLEDGVITFPTKSLLVSFASEYEDGGWYYGNVDYTNPSDDSNYGPGTFCIDLNSLVASAAPAKKFSAAAAAFVKNSMKAKTFDVPVKKASKVSKKITAKDIKEYRLNNLTTVSVR